MTVSENMRKAALQGYGRQVDALHRGLHQMWRMIEDRRPGLVPTTVDLWEMADAELLGTLQKALSSLLGGN